MVLVLNKFTLAVFDTINIFSVKVTVNGQQQQQGGKEVEDCHNPNHHSIGNVQFPRQELNGQNFSTNAKLLLMLGLGIVYNMKGARNAQGKYFKNLLEPAQSSSEKAT